MVTKETNHWLLKDHVSVMFIGSISAALSCLVYPPREVRGWSAGSFPEQRLVIEPMMFNGVCEYNRRCYLCNCRDGF